MCSRIPFSRIPGLIGFLIISPVVGTSHLGFSTPNEFRPVSFVGQTSKCSASKFISFFLVAGSEYCHSTSHEYCHSTSHNWFKGKFARTPDAGNKEHDFRFRFSSKLVQSFPCVGVHRIALSHLCFPLFSSISESRIPD